MCERKKTNTLKTATGERLQFLFAFYFGYYRRWRYLFTSASFRHRNIGIAKRASKKINKCKKKLINEKIKCQRESLNQRARLLSHQPLIFFNKQREIRRWRGDRAGFISPPTVTLLLSLGLTISFLTGWISTHLYLLKDIFTARGGKWKSVFLTNRASFSSLEIFRQSFGCSTVEAQKLSLGTHWRII